MSISSISHLGGWVYGFVFAFCALQSAGVPVPGTSALIAAAVYAGTSHHLEIATLIAAAAGGAILGNAVGFALGWWGGATLLERYGRYLRLTRERVEVGRYVLARHGGKLVFFGRFISGLRTYAAFLAGLGRMSPRRFVTVSSLAVIAWSVINGLQYYFFAHALDAADTIVTVLLIVLGAAVLLGTALLLRRQGRKLMLEAELARTQAPDPT